MPITQPRMLALLAAAQDASETLEECKRLASAAARRVTSGKADPRDELLQLDAMLDTLAQRPLRFARTIATEAAHFRAMKRKNESAQRRQARRRAELGISPAQFNTAPHAIDYSGADNLDLDTLVAAPLRDPTRQFREVSPERRAEIEAEAERALAEAVQAEASSPDPGAAVLLRANEDDASGKPPGSYDGPPLEEEEEE